VYVQGQQVLSAEELDVSNVGGVWLSGFHFARNAAKLAKLNIGAVVSALELHFDYSQLNPERLVLNIEDDPSENIIKHLDDVYNFIERQRERTNVLVHCAAGISRSSALLIGYLIRKYGMTYDQAEEHLRQRRRIIKPNPGFQKQLR
jgi:protein-tyrosine phosphatase